MDRRPTCPQFFYQGRWWYTFGDKCYSYVWMRSEMQEWRYRGPRNVYVDATPTEDATLEMVTCYRWFPRWVSLQEWQQSLLDSSTDA